MRAPISIFVSVLLLSAPVACVRTTPRPALAYWVSSDESQYSPNVRVRVSTVRDGSSLTVMLDSGGVAVPGSFTAESPVMMRDLYLTAYIASPNVTPMGLVRDNPARFAERRGWQVVAQSDSTVLVDQLRFGERRVIRSVILRMDESSVTTGAHWLVLGITGESVDLRVAVDEKSSGLRVGPPGNRRVQVYACSDRDLGGQLDTARSHAMRRAYGLLC